MISPEELEKYIMIFDSIVDKFEPERQKLVKDMFAEKSISERYFTAPASSRVEYHNCFPGGLLLHSLNVVSNLKKICKTFAPDVYSISKIGFVGLFHDFGKIGDLEEPMYIEQTSNWHKNNGKLYELNPKVTWMPNAERGLYILQHYGIKLEADEYLAIRLNDGQYDDNNKGYRSREPNLAILLHMADLWSSRQEKDQVINS